MMNTKKEMLTKLQQYDFTLKELQLYLDTHPECTNGLAAFGRYKALRDEAAIEYTAMFGPLTVDCCSDAHHWQWVDEPFPWEV